MIEFFGRTASALGTMFHTVILVMGRIITVELVVSAGIVLGVGIVLVGRRIRSEWRTL